MSKTRFTPWIVLACIGTLAGCTSGEGGTAGNTELNVVIPNGSGNGSTAPAGFDIQVVEYTINCIGAPTDGFPGIDNIDTTFDPDVQINGVLEVLDDPSLGPIASPDGFGGILDEAYVWQGFMDIPLDANCTVQLRARDADGEVICSATEPFDTNTILAGQTVKVNVLMECGLSFQAPVGMLDLDGDFQFNIANFCPSLYALNCIDSELDVRATPAGDLLVTACQVRADDGDGTCGTACDDQCCQQTADGSGLECFQPGGPDPTPSVPGTFQCPPSAPAPVLTTTVTCSSASNACAISCDGLGASPTGSCVFTGDVLGDVGGPAPGAPPIFGGPGAGPGGFFVSCATQVVTDPVTGLDVTVPLFPGDTITCTAVTNDGDDDCEKTKTVDLTVEGLTACGEYFDGGGDCDDSDPCTIDVCDDGTCLGTFATCCDNTQINLGGSCTTGTGAPGTCNATGGCDASGCDQNPPLPGQCNPADDCNFADSCDLGTFLCVDEGSQPDDTACDAGLGGLSGSCQTGVCEDICDNTTCTVNPTECVSNICDPVDGSCDPTNDPLNTPCDPGTGNPGTCGDADGVCNEQISCPPGDPAAQAVAGVLNCSLSGIAIDLPLAMSIDPDADIAGVATCTANTTADTDIILPAGLLPALQFLCGCTGVDLAANGAFIATTGASPDLTTVVPPQFVPLTLGEVTLSGTTTDTQTGDGAASVVYDWTALSVVLLDVGALGDLVLSSDPVPGRIEPACTGNAGAACTFTSGVAPPNTPPPIPGTCLDTSFLDVSLGEVCANFDAACAGNAGAPCDFDLDGTTTDGVCLNTPAGDVCADVPLCAVNVPTITFP